jgi:hypothetical protein
MTQRKDMLTRRQAAEYLGVSHSWLSSHKADGPTVTRVGRKVFYLKADLDAFIRAQRGKPAPTAAAGRGRRKAAPPPLTAAAPTAAAAPARRGPEATRVMPVETVQKMREASVRTSPPPLPPSPGRLARRPA